VAAAAARPRRNVTYFNLYFATKEKRSTEEKRAGYA